MNMRDIHSDMKATILLAIQNLKTAVLNSTGITRQGFSGKEFLVLFGAAGDTLGVGDHYEVRIQESANGTDWTAVASDDHVMFSAPLGTAGLFLDVNGNAKAGLAYRIGYIGNREYARIQIEGIGTLTNGTDVAVVCVQTLASQSPVDAPNTI